MDDKRIFIYYLTNQGKIIAEKLKSIFPTAKVFSKPFNLDKFFEKGFNEADFLIPIMAVGIVVRKISKLIKSKLNDPGIVVIDDKGKFAVSLLSGHIGGANELVKIIEEKIGAKAVITTSTDVNEKIAIDLIAKKYNWKIANTEMIKKINMAILNNEKIATNIPQAIINEKNFIHYKKIGNVLRSKIENKVIVTNLKKIKNDKKFLHLVPKNIYIGIGCNRGTTLKEIENVILTELEKLNRSIESINSISTAEIKKDEKGIIELANKFKIPVRFYSFNELNKVENVIKSSYLQKKFGVKGVCEPASVLSAQKDLKSYLKMKKLIPKKKIGNVTISIHELIFI